MDVLKMLGCEQFDQFGKFFFFKKKKTLMMTKSQNFFNYKNF